MSKRTETNKQVVIRNKNSTEIWEKNRAGSTTKEGYSRVSGGNRYDYWGKKKGKG